MLVWACLGALYLMVGAVVTNFGWDEHLDEFYGGLTSIKRYIFFFVVFAFWPIVGSILLVRWLGRKKALEEE